MPGPSTGAISAPGNRTTYTRNTNNSNTLTLAAGSTTDSCDIGAGPQRAYDPGAPGYDPQGSDPDAALVANFSFP